MIPALLLILLLALVLWPGWAVAIILATVAGGKWLDWRRERRHRQWAGWWGRP